jgi:predicted phage terminase large subunit-like protein
MHGWLNYSKKLLTEKEKELLSTLRLDTENPNLYPIWRLPGFWVSIQLRKLLWHLTRLTLRLILVVESEIWWVQTRIRTSSLISNCKRIVNRLLGGVRTLMGNILQSVLAVLWLVGVPTYSLLMTHIQNKMQSWVNQMFFLPAWEWFQSGPLQRLMPGGAIVVVMTRWSKLDLTGQIVNQMVKNDDVDQWEVVEFPAILQNSMGEEVPLWPEFWSIEELQARRAAIDIRYWNAQYLQNPVSEEGALIKREWWNIWEEEDPPVCEFIIMTLDAAQEANNRADYNALTTWGVFFNEDVNNYNIILLNAIKQRLEFPELKQLCIEEYREWEPDAFIVEKKSNGAALYQEFRRMGIPVGEFTPGKGQDKISRVNAVSDLFAGGVVWAPDRRWAHEVIEECNDFPSGANDDLVDSTTLALSRFRQGGFIRLPSDEEDDIQMFKGHGQKRHYAI